MPRDAERPSSDGSMNLLPMMNLVTLLIPLLLIATQFAELAIIDSSVPGIADPVEPLPGPPPLQLRLEVGGDGVRLVGAEPVLSPDTGEPSLVPCAPGACGGPESYDTAELSRLLGLVKEAHPDERTVIVQPEGGVPFDVLVAVMDAARGDGGAPLFPEVVFAGG